MIKSVNIHTAKIVYTGGPVVSYLDCGFEGPGFDLALDEFFVRYVSVSPTYTE